MKLVFLALVLWFSCLYSFEYILEVAGTRTPLLVFGKAGWHQSGRDACLEGAGGEQHLNFSRTLLGRRAVLAEHFRMDPKPILSLGKLDGAAGMTENAVPAKRGRENHGDRFATMSAKNTVFDATLSCSSCSLCQSTQASPSRTASSLQKNKAPVSADS